MSFLKLEENQLGLSWKTPKEFHMGVRVRQQLGFDLVVDTCFFSVGHSRTRQCNKSPQSCVARSAAQKRMQTGTATRKSRVPKLSGAFGLLGLTCPHNLVSSAWSHKIPQNAEFNWSCAVGQLPSSLCGPPAPQILQAHKPFSVTRLSNPEGH